MDGMNQIVPVAEEHWDALLTETKATLARIVSRESPSPDESEHLQTAMCR
jgi:hypothetical protein